MLLLTFGNKFAGSSSNPSINGLIIAPPMSHKQILQPSSLIAQFAEDSLKLLVHLVQFIALCLEAVLLELLLLTTL